MLLKKELLKKLFFTFFFFYSINLFANLTGTIKDENGEAIKNVLINLEKDTGDGNPIKIASTLSDNTGKFNFSIPEEEIYFFKFIKNGFQAKTVTLTINPIREQNIEVTLNKINVLEEVRVRRRTSSSSEREAVASTILDEETVRNIKINKVDDLSSVSASLLSVNTGSSLTSFFSLRGVSSANTTDPLVGMYIDDIAQFQSYNFPVQLNTITSIEILKGPQLTFYGRNAMGGIIDIKTQKLLNRLSINAHGDWGNYGLQKYNFSASVPIINETAILNFGGFYNTFDGYFRNTTLGKNSGGEESFGTFLATDLYFRNLEFNIGTRFERNDEEAFPYSRSVAETEANPYTIRHNQDNHNIKYTSDSFLKIKFPIEYFIFNSISTYQYFDNTLNFDLDFGSGSNDQMDLAFDSHLFTQEFKITSTSISSEIFSWVAGSYLYYQKRDIESDFTVLPNVTKVTTDENSAGVALYGSITYPIIPSVHFIVGIRGDYDYRGSKLARTTSSDATSQPENTEKNNFNYAPKLGFNFYPTENLLIYLSGTRGYRNGGVNPFVSDSSKVLYDSESSWNGELGLKYNFLDGNLSTSVYYIYWENQQVNVVFASDSSIYEFGIVNAGKSQNIGYELEVNSPSFWGISLGGNFSYIYSRYLNFSLENFNNELVDVSNNNQSFVPDISYSVYLQYKYDFEVLSKRDNFTIRSTLKYIGDVFFDSFNQQRQEPYYLLDITTNFQIAGFVLSFWMKNVLNKKYYSLIFDTGVSDLAPNKLGDPRSFGGKLSFIF